MHKKTINLCKQEQKSGCEYKINNNMVNIYSNISLLRLNVNELKIVIKSQRL